MSKNNVYEVAWSLKKDPNKWESSRIEQDALQFAIMQIMSNAEWQLECVALIASSNKNRNELSIPQGK